MASRSAQVAPKHLLGVKRRGLAGKGQPLGLPQQVLAQRPVEQMAGQAYTGLWLAALLRGLHGAVWLPPPV